MKQRLAWLVMAVGVVGVIIGISGVLTHIGRIHAVIHERAHTAPAVFTEQMTAGTWQVFELTGTRSTHGIGAFSATVGSTLPPMAFLITGSGPAGAPIPITPRRSGIVLTLTRGSSVFTAEASMRVAVAGRYSFRVQTAGGAPTTVLVTPDLGSAVVAILPWVAVGVFGFLMAVLGLILLAVRRRNDRPPVGTGRVRTAPMWGPPVSEVPRFW